MSESEAVATEALEAPATEAAPSLTESLGAIFDKVQEAPTEPSEGPARDPAGRFAGKQTEVQAPTVPDSEPEDPAIAAPPQSWTAQMREKWSTLSPDVRKYVGEREAETHRRITEQGQEVARLKQLDEVVSPYRQAFNLAGVQEAAALKQVLEVQSLLQRDPVNGLRWIAQQYGVTADQLTQMAPEGPRDPYVATLLNKVQQLEAATAAQQAQATQAMQSGIATEIETFAKDPARPHFEAVREEMGRLIGSGVASTFADAYDKAVWSVPTIRAQLIAEERKAAAAELEKARQAEQAKRAQAVNVRGASAPGAVGAPRSMRESMSAAYDRLNAS
jgi:hypothetical protein